MPLPNQPHISQCLDAGLTAAAANAVRSPFVLPVDAGGRRAADAARRALGDSVGGLSDHLAVVAAFEGWEFAKAQGRDRPFCAQNYLSFGTLQMMAGLRTQLRSALAARGIGTDRRAAGANSQSGANSKGCTDRPV